jgi:hypothetical protein
VPIKQGAMAQVMLSYRVADTGHAKLGGDGSVLLLQASLESLGYSVFVGEAGEEGLAAAGMGNGWRPREWGAGRAGRSSGWAKPGARGH